MIIFLWNLLLSLFWSAITGEFNLRNLSYGFIIGYFVLFIVSRALGIERYFFKTKKIVLLIFLTVTELIKSSFKIAFDILTPHNHMRPGIIKIQLEGNTSTEITFFSNLISLTPGTLSLDISDDKNELYVHVMYLNEQDLQGVRMAIKQKFERHIMELFR